MPLPLSCSRRAWVRYFGANSKADNLVFSLGTGGHSPPRAPDRSKLRFLNPLTVSTKGTRMENNHRHGDTGCSVPAQGGRYALRQQWWFSSFHAWEDHETGAQIFLSSAPEQAACLRRPHFTKFFRMREQKCSGNEVKLRFATGNGNHSMANMEHKKTRAKTGVWWIRAHQSRHWSWQRRSRRKAKVPAWHTARSCQSSSWSIPSSAPRFQSPYWWAVGQKTEHTLCWGHTQTVKRDWLSGEGNNK